MGLTIFGVVMVEHDGVSIERHRKGAGHVQGGSRPCGEVSPGEIEGAGTAVHVRVDNGLDAPRGIHTSEQSGGCTLAVDVPVAGRGLQLYSAGERRRGGHAGHTGRLAHGCREGIRGQR